MTLNENQSELWTKLASFQIDETGQILGFRGRLARENGWSHPYTHRVVEEYRKFLFLCFAAGHPCSPSDQVDQAWHLHLTYTRSYWDRLCGQVLPGPLHHEPTKGGPEESAKFDDWYDRTLESYRRLFDCEPPIDIWPPTESRFGKPLPERTTAEYWMIPKARAKRAFAFLSLFGIATGAAVGCGETGDAETIVPLLMMAAFVAVILFLIAFLPKTGWKGAGGPEGVGTSRAGVAPMEEAPATDITAEVTGDMAATGAEDTDVADMGAAGMDVEAADAAADINPS
ncbi:glycine-rich domain-containing protein [Fimbriimonas ginsengisoli]|uniref:Glycine-rich domain-containing protein-like n=1 Tax=Fimbriimonas ginsengisoli Gsoil 348 TaxID=661478 RepID=A0A068NVI1_FIMGI|nr:hypothetical protein [Fimbriimonas ginsengisoli]AIE87387.1 hypothetical protein OP10G_4019 [Fimbriimonas ginsengisoli Gsoil 348]